MRLLDRYLLRELLVPLGYCLGGFLLFWTVFDLFTSLGDLQEEAASIGENPPAPDPILGAACGPTLLVADTAHSLE